MYNIYIYIYIYIYHTISAKYPLLGGHSTIYMYKIFSLFKLDAVYVLNWENYFF